MFARPLRLLLAGCVLAASVCSAADPLTPSSIDALYDLAWQETNRSSPEPLIKPRLQPIHPEDIFTLAGVYIFDYGSNGFGEAILTIQGQKWTLKQKSGVQEGQWRLIGNKIVLLRGRSTHDLRAFVRRIGGRWHFSDADLPRVVTPLKPKA